MTFSLSLIGQAQSQFRKREHSKALKKATTNRCLLLKKQQQLKRRDRNWFGRNKATNDSQNATTVITFVHIKTSSKSYKKSSLEKIKTRRNLVIY